MTSCCPLPRMRWSGATGAIARCKKVSTGCGRKRRSVRAWRWICGVKPKPKAVNKPSPHFIVHGLDKPGVFTTVSEEEAVPRVSLVRGEVPLKQRQLHDSLLLAWHFDVFFYAQLARQLADKRRYVRWLACAMPLACAGAYQDDFLPGSRQADVKEPTFLGNCGVGGVHREETVLRAADKGHRKL